MTITSTLLSTTDYLIFSLTKDDFYFPGENPYTMTSVPSQEKAPIMADQKPHQHKQHRPSPTARKLAVYIINVIAGVRLNFMHSYLF